VCGALIRAHLGPASPLSTLIRFAWWTQYHQVKGGMNSIRNFISAVCEWNSSLGYEDPRSQEKRIYARFRREADKHLEVYAGPWARRGRNGHSTCGFPHKIEDL
jgi:hypothetical protein